MTSPNRTSNLTTTVPPPSPAVDQVYEALLLTSQVFTYYCVAVHVIYILLALAFRELHKATLIFIHHAAIVSIFYLAGMLIFQFVNPAAFADQRQVVILCSFFEYYWPLSIYMRMFSILLIALHRYLGVFKPDLFKKLNQLVWPLVLLVLAAWACALILTVIGKYSFSATYSLTFCLDGFSPVWLNNLLYAIFYVTLSMFVPGTVIVIIYVMINRRLKSVARKVNANKIDGTNSQQPSTSNRSINQRRERRYANQFILLCLCVVLNISGISIYSVRALVPNYFSVFFYVRPVVRIWILVMASLVPILSVAFNPHIRRAVVGISSFTKSYISQPSNTGTT